MEKENYSLTPMSGLTPSQILKNTLRQSLTGDCIRICTCNSCITSETGISIQEASGGRSQSGNRISDGNFL